MQAAISRHNGKSNNYGTKAKRKDPFAGGRSLEAIKENPNLDYKEKAIFLELASRQDFTKNFQLWRFESHEEIKRRTGFSISTVKRTLKKLQEKGYIQIGHRYDKHQQVANEYLITRKIFDEYLNLQTDEPRIVRILKEVKPKAIEERQVKYENEVKTEAKTDLNSDLPELDASSNGFSRSGCRASDQSPQSERGEPTELRDPALIPALDPSDQSFIYPEKNKKEEFKNSIPKDRTSNADLFVGKEGWKLGSVNEGTLNEMDRLMGLDSFYLKSSD
jgi:DNA-binding MarR family transcriptional regulator